MRDLVVFCSVEELTLHFDLKTFCTFFFAFLICFSFSVALPSTHLGLWGDRVCQAPLLGVLFVVGEPWQPSQGLEEPPRLGSAGRCTGRPVLQLQSRVRGGSGCPQVLELGLDSAVSLVSIFISISIFCLFRFTFFFSFSVSPLLVVEASTSCCCHTSTPAFSSTGMLWRGPALFLTRSWRRVSFSFWTVSFYLLLTINFSVGRLLQERGAIYAYRRHAIKNFIQFRSGPSSQWRTIVKPEDLLPEEATALAPYQWSHVPFLRVSLLIFKFDFG